jgi:cytosine deaminase
VTELVVRRAHQVDGSGPWDIRIAGGIIEAIVPAIDDGPRAAGSVPAHPDREAIVIDAGGGTALPALIDAHCHLDQSLLGAAWTPIPASMTFMQKIHAAEDLMMVTAEPPLAGRVEALARLLVANGTLAARSHVSITPRVGLAGVEALVTAREALRDRLDLQLVAFPQFGLRDPAMARLMNQAIESGCDIVGGMDPGSVDGDVEWSLAATFELAGRHGLPIDIHVHDPGLLGRFTLERIAAWTASTGMAGRVIASHALCLGELAPRDNAAVLHALADAGVGVVTAANPNAAMPRPPELQAHGVRLGLGSDTAHTSAPFGTSDMLRKANLLAQRHTWVSDGDLLRALGMVTSGNAEILGLRSVQIATGEPADLVIVGARNGAEAVASPAGRRTVIARGRVVADRRTEVAIEP